MERRLMALSAVLIALLSLPSAAVAQDVHRHERRRLRTGRNAGGRDQRGERAPERDTIEFSAAVRATGIGLGNCPNRSTRGNQYALYANDDVTIRGPVAIHGLPVLGRSERQPRARRMRPSNATHDRLEHRLPAGRRVRRHGAGRTRDPGPCRRPAGRRRSRQPELLEHAGVRPGQPELVADGGPQPDRGRHRRDRGGPLLERRRSRSRTNASLAPSCDAYLDHNAFFGEAGTGLDAASAPAGAATS